MRIDHLYKILRNAGMRVNDVTKFAELYRQGETTLAIRKQLLADCRDQLADKITELQKLLDSPV